MDLSNKGKSLTTSVPSMAIRFNATAEEIEEVFTKEENHRDDAVSEGPVLPTTEKSTDIETSPRRSILPLLGKRSVSVDVNSTGAPQDSSPPSDPWRFLSDIKGKITKSVEVKFTEYKTRTAENEGSPKITNKDKTKDKDNSKENSSLSDSEEASESSISKTCGVVSTTEGVEMSSDDDTPSLSEEDKQQQHANKKETLQFTGLKDGAATASNTSVRQRFRLNSHKSATPLKEGSFGAEFLENMQKISEGQPAAVPEEDLADDDESLIESGVDALAEINISNFRMDSDNVLNIDEVSGADIRNAEFGQDGYYDDLETVYAPSGFVDLRRSESNHINWFQFGYKNKPVWLTVLCLTFYFYLPLSLYASGFIAGSLVISVVWCIYIKLHYDPLQLKPSGITLKSFVEIPSVKEHQPLKKYEGWMNEYPEEYNPLTYHVSQTQSVYLRLQGNFLKVSHTRQKIPKRAMWNEPEYKQVFTRHRIYNLQGAKVVLLPDGLAKVRQWSKKYPICVVLNKDQVNFEGPSTTSMKKKDIWERDIPTQEKRTDSLHEIDIAGMTVHENKSKKSVHYDLSSHTLIKSDIAQVFSKLVDNLDDSDPQVGTTVTNNGLWPHQTESMELFATDLTSDRSDLTEIMGVEEEEDDMSVCMEEWHDVDGPMQINPEDTRLYLFSRTCRDKEDWFRRLRLAARQNGDQEHKTSLDDEYIAYMRMRNVFFTDDRQDQQQQQQRIPHSLYTNDNVWVNAILARVLFDCAREESITQRIKERIQRKLASIRLPYFIQELHCEELNLGRTTPVIVDNGTPTLDERGLWIDLDVSYEGLIVVILQTKVNLMKLKTVHLPDRVSERAIDDKPAIFHSDVDDSAESSTDDEPPKHVPSFHQAVLDSKGNPLPGLGGSSKGSKKLMKMVDKIAESKFFQAATENKYIKRAMQEFSNTNLRLKVELKKCVGQLAINIPPPPSDRIWIGFRIPPELVLSAHPIVGDRSIGFMRVTSWIEKRIYKEFQKIFVIPNMEDLLIPVMSPKLPQ